jgi:hypothetical protein
VGYTRIAKELCIIVEDFFDSFQYGRDGRFYDSRNDVYCAIKYGFRNDSGTDCDWVTNEFRESLHSFLADNIPTKSVGEVIENK